MGCGIDAEASIWILRQRVNGNGIHGPSRSILTFHSFRSKFHPDFASSASHVDDAQELSLGALQESADAFPNPYLKGAVNGVSALWQTAEVEQSF